MEDIIQLLELLGPVPEELIQKIDDIDDLDILNQWLLIAAKASSIEDFEEKIKDSLN